MPEPGLAVLPVTRVAGFRKAVPFAETCEITPSASIWAAATR